MNRIEKISKEIETSVDKYGKMEAVFKWLTLNQTEENGVKERLTSDGYTISPIYNREGWVLISKK